MASPTATGILTTNGQKIVTVNRDLYFGLASVTAAANQSLIFDLGGASGGSLNLANAAANSLVPRAENRTIYIYSGSQGTATVDSNGLAIDWVTLDAATRSNLPSGLSYSQISHNGTGSTLSDPTVFTQVALWNLNSSTADLTIKATGTVTLIGNTVLRNLTILSATSVTQAAGSTGSGQSLIYTNRLALGGSLSLGTISGAVILNGRTAAANLILGSADSVTLADEQVMGTSLALGTVAGAVTIAGKTTIGSLAVGRTPAVVGSLTITQADSVTITSRLAIHGELRITRATNAVTLTGSVSDFSRTNSVMIGTAGSVNLNGGYNVSGNFNLSSSGAVALDGTNNVSGILTIGASSMVTETTTASLWVDGELNIVSSGAVSLAGVGNQINGIGAVTSGGTLSIKTNNNLYLSGNLTSAGAISLTASSIVLQRDIVTSGGNLTMTLTGTFDSNEQVGYSLSSSGRDITMPSRGALRKLGAIVFKLTSPGSVGTFTQTMVGLENYTSSPTGYFYSGFRKPGISGVMADEIHSIEDLRYQGITRNQTDLSDPTKFVGSESLDLSNRDVTFYGVLVDGAISLTARSINFRGSNSFGDLKLTVTGNSGVTQNQIATSLDVRGILWIDSAGAIALGNITNRIAKLGFLKTLTSPSAAGTIQINSQPGLSVVGEINGASSLSLTTDGELVVNTTAEITAAGSILLTGKNGITLQRSGTITATGASSNLEFRSVLGNISITGSGPITVGRNLNLVAEAGSLTLANSGVITVTGEMVATHGKGIEWRNTGALSAARISLTTSGGALRLTDTAAMTIGGSFSATAAMPGITFSNVGAISASGTYSLTTTGALILGTVGTQSGSSLSFNGGSLTLTSGLTSSGGAVTIALGTGTYGNGLTDGWVWTTTNQNLDISLGRRSTKTGTVF
ncbi:MAG: hypothetical protein ORO03_09285, partial [Alphaproteobacteria bacterium]|nr:hypothetical protein [Alphaproteobacteria bacterium]